MSLVRPSTLELILGIVIAFLGEALSPAEIQGVGTWKLNIGRSQLGPGQAPQSMTSTIEVVGQSARITGVRIGADGIRTESQYTAKLDGKDYPIKGSPNADTVSLKRIDSRTIERTDKRAGKVVETSTTVFSEDGKSSITTGTGKDARGEDFDFVIVNEKQ